MSRIANSERRVARVKRKTFAEVFYFTPNPRFNPNPSRTRKEARALARQAAKETDGQFLERVQREVKQ